MEDEYPLSQKPADGFWELSLRRSTIIYNDDITAFGSLLRKEIPRTSCLDCTSRISKRTLSSFFCIFLVNRCSRICNGTVMVVVDHNFWVFCYKRGRKFRFQLLPAFQFNSTNDSNLNLKFIINIALVLTCPFKGKQSCLNSHGRPDDHKFGQDALCFVYLK